jgi:diaminopimelate decarboxylase
MNDLIRPALYSAWQEIVAAQTKQGDAQQYDIVGPVCESADFLGKDRQLIVDQGDLLAVRSSGAYGFVMSSNYNTRPRAAEVMVDGKTSHLIRERETVAELFQNEHCLPENS